MVALQYHSMKGLALASDTCPRFHAEQVEHQTNAFT